MSGTPTGLPNLNLTLGALFVGVILSVFLFGIATLQSYNYYNTFPKDRLVFKTVVGGLWVLDALHVAFVAHSVYYYSIANFANPKALGSPVWSININTLLTALVSCCCQGFFVVRIWALGRSYIVTSTCAILCVTRLAFSIVTTYYSFAIPDIPKYEAVASWSIRAGLSTSAVADVCIASALVFYLSRNRTGFQKTDRIITRLLTFTIETCLLTSVVTVLDLICFVTMPENFIFLGLYFLVSKLYSNALLTSLNARQNMREKGGSSTVVSSNGGGGVFSTTGSRTLAPMSFSKNGQFSHNTQTDTIDIELTAPTRKEY